jgi:hypothetical protein
MLHLIKTDLSLEEFKEFVVKLIVLFYSISVFIACRYR